MRYLLFSIFTLIIFSGCSPITMVTLPYHAYAVGTDERDSSTLASDQQIKLSIRGKLFNHADTSLYNVSIESFYGDVYIIGTYKDKIEVTQSVKLAKETDGVKSVETYMVEKVDKENCGMTSSTTMLLDIKNRFAKDEHINPSNIHVHVVQCDVIVAGVAKNNTEKVRAEWIAQNTNGIHNFKSFIKLSPNN